MAGKIIDGNGGFGHLYCAAKPVFPAIFNRIIAIVVFCTIYLLYYSGDEPSDAMFAGYR